MGRKIELRVGDEVAVAEMMEDEAPKTCEAIWNLLPCRGTLVHAKMAGPEFLFKVPIFIDVENPTRDQKEGNIAYWHLGQTICVFYQNLFGIGPANTFARIIENLPGIQAEGLKGWKQQGAPIEMRKKVGYPSWKK